jgi:hypothetical protein
VGLLDGPNEVLVNEKDEGDDVILAYGNDDAILNILMGQYKYIQGCLQSNDDDLPLYTIREFLYNVLLQVVIPF